MIKNIYEKFLSKYFDRVNINENISKYHTFKIDGVADIVALPKSRDELIGMIKLCRENGYKHQIIGNGSNILFENNCYSGVLISTKKMNSVLVDGTDIICDCGASMPSVAYKALKHSLSGLEGISGVPGTIGGAIKMNAGAHGTEIKDLLKTITVFDKNNSVLDLTPEDLEMTYRHSNVAEKGYIVLGCVLTLTEGCEEDINSTIVDFKNRRLKSQPLEYPSAGSIFKRCENHFAGKLIDDCGLKGYSIGGAEVSHKHANFIINKSNATTNDVVELISHIQAVVKNNYDICLKTEVELIS